MHHTLRRMGNGLAALFMLARGRILSVPTFSLKGHSHE